MKNFTGRLVAFVAILAMLVATLAFAYGDTNFTNVVAEDVTVSDDLSVGDTLTVIGASTFAAAITQSDGDLTVADDLVLAAQTAITVTDGAAFAPTGTYQAIQAAAEVTPTITAGATAGTVVTLINTSAQTINLADSGTLMLSAAGALGQYDALILWSDGTNWIEISRSNN